MGFPGGLVIKNPPANAGDMGLIPGLGRSPRGGDGDPILVFLPGKYHGQRSLVGYSPRGCKESDMTECLTVSISFQYLLSTCIIFRRHLGIERQYRIFPYSLE